MADRKGARSAVFAQSDIRDAAEVFIEAIAEHAETMWEPDDIDALVIGLTEKTFEILRDPKATW